MVKKVIFVFILVLGLTACDNSMLKTEDTDRMMDSESNVGENSEYGTAKEGFGIEEQLDAAWESRWENVADDEIKEALQSLYTLYDADSLVKWFALLWDNDAGGFYYANSARDYAGFAVDLESTYQILNIMQGMGMIEKAGSLPVLLGEELTNKIVTYVQSTQSKADGYFYNPQFGTDVGTTRKGRDLEQSIKVLNWLGAEPLYKTALERLEESGESGSDSTSAGWPEYMQSEEAFIANVKKLLETGTQENIGNTLNGQKAQILAAGLLPTALDILDEYQDPETGMWGTKREDGTFYTLEKYNGGEAKTQSLNSVLTCAYKIAQLYNGDSEQGRAIKYREAYAKTAIEGIVSDAKPERVTYLLNPWASLNNLRANIATFDGDMDMASYSSLLAENGNEMLAGLNSKLAVYRKEDGSYSYYPQNSLDIIYSTPVSAGLNEGDVNGTMLAIKSISDAVKGVFCEFNTQGINLFNYKHGEALVEAMKANILPEKIIIDYNTPNLYEFTMGIDGSVINERGITTKRLKDATKVYYATNPTDAADIVLKLETNDPTGTAGGNLYVTLIDKLNLDKLPDNDNTGITEMTAEMDIYIPSDVKLMNEEDRRLYHIRVGSTSSKYIHLLTVNLPESSDATFGQGFYFGDGKHWSWDKNQAWSDNLFAFDVWHHLKLVYTIENVNATPNFGGVKIYMNDEFVAESQNYYANDFDSTDTNKNDINYGTLAFYREGEYTMLIGVPAFLDGELLIDNLTGSVKYVEHAAKSHN